MMSERNRSCLRSKPRRVLLGGVFLLVVASLGVAAEPATQPARDEARLDGFWPTPRMLESLVRRWAAKAARKYDLRPDQHQEMEEKLVERWSKFMQEHRAKIQPLANEFIEARLGMEPPTEEQVAGWAQRALPVYDEMRRHIESTELDVRSVMNASQQAEFDLERVRRNLTLQVFEAKLKVWSEGHFKRNEWWKPPPGYEEARAATTQPAGSAGDAVQAGADRPEALPPDAPPPDRIVQELNAWEQYVADFCDRFDLDRSQRNAAESMLREMLERARTHVRLHRDRIAALEKAMSDPRQADEAEFNKELDELYGPLDDMFHRLDERLNKLPTTGQRRAVEGEAGSSSTPPTPSPSP